MSGVNFFLAPVIFCFRVLACFVISVLSFDFLDITNFLRDPLAQGRVKIKVLTRLSCCLSLILSFCMTKWENLKHSFGDVLIFLSN